VVAVLQPVLLVLLVLAELLSGWAAVRSARIGYLTSFALARGEPPRPAALYTLGSTMF
jgi:hypothetical protein